jgi:NAD+ dependent glucose-6-phosphate dehydrogenase
MSQRQRVLVTGACGDIASQVLPELRERHAVTLIDVSISDRAGHPVEGVIQADLAASDASSYERHFVGVDVVLHLGYQRPPGTASPMERFEIELTNVRMAQNVYHCAYESGVRRVVVGSSNHAADWYEHALIHAGQSDVVRPTDLPLSDNFYGWAKASYELLGFVYASGTLGRKLEVVQLRIGAARDVAGRHYEDGPMVQHVSPGASGLANFKRDLGAYISSADLSQLVRCAIETRRIENKHGVPWQIVYGISNNTRAFWSLESARRVLGYAPQDDSEVVYADDIRRLLTGPAAVAAGGRVGA